MKRILVPTDFSNNAYNALLYATRLFPKEEVIISMVHTIEEVLSRSTSRVDIGKSEEVFTQLQRETQSKLEELKHAIVRDTEGFTCTFSTQFSTLPIHKMVNALCAKDHVDLVIMGTKGAKGLSEILLGSQAVKVIQKNKKCPLLLVPFQSDSRPPKNVCFATDFKRTLDEEQWSLFSDIVQSTESVVHIAHIYDQKEPDVLVEGNYKALKKKLGELPYNTHWISNKGSKAKALQDFINVNTIDLLTMVYNRRNFLDRIFREPVIKNIGFHIQIPFLIVPE